MDGKKYDLKCVLRILDNILASYSHYDFTPTDVDVEAYLIDVNFKSWF